MTPDGTTASSELIHESGTNNPCSSQPVLQSPPESGTTLADKTPYRLYQHPNKGKYSTLPHD